MKILDSFYSLLKPGWTIVDLGAGEGKYAKQMVDLGVKVIAVDSREPKEIDDSISWNILPIQEWIAKLSEGDVFDAILMRYSLQFFEKDFIQKELVPILSKHLRAGGLFAIETFYQAPKPPFERPFLSYWTEDEVAELFFGWKILASGTKNRKYPRPRWEDEGFL